ncbi:hypothetical protein SAMN04488038_10667 [Solimonas aquatica]|uniref:NHL repeat-containing protein n=1 Tax=Solimonas aquatica TaxID=489703 RepID=A0A1H9FS31_9GAMM|nr:hypothetical protein [Solimonas aquatica]SEQ40313.1 hypothetical protein SAMN04488038_10667 [Solimonas aquatica]
MSANLSKSLIVPEYKNGKVSAYIPDPMSGAAQAYPSYQIDVQAIIDSLFPGQGRIAAPNACALHGNDLFIACSSPNAQCVLKLADYLHLGREASAKAFVFTLDGNDYVGMAFDAANLLYVAEGNFGDNQIVQYSGTGGGYPGAATAGQDNYSTRIVLGNAGKTSYFANLVFDAAGNLWASDYQNHRVVVFTPTAAGWQWRELSNLSGPIPVANSTAALSAPSGFLFAQPEGLDFDAAGNLWVANNNDGSGGVKNGKTSLVRLSPALQAALLSQAPGSSHTPPLASANNSFFIYQLPNLNNNAGAQPQLGGLQIDRALGRLYVNEEAGLNGRAYDIATLAGIGTTTAGNDLSVTSTNPGNGGLVLVSSHAAVLYIRDAPGDSGAEPDVSTTRPWETGEIWPRQIADGGLVQQDLAPGQPAVLYARVINRGLTPSDGSEVLRSYWVRASTGLAVPGNWNGASPGNGGMINAQVPIPVIAAGGSALVPTNWPNPPTPASAADSDTHYCLLAHITQPGAAAFAGFPGSDLMSDVLALRSVAWRNIHIIAPNTIQKMGRFPTLGVVRVQNTSTREISTQLEFEILDGHRRAARHEGAQLLLEPHGRLLEQLAGAHHALEAPYPGIYQLRDPKRGLPQLRLAPGETQSLTLSYVLEKAVKGFAIRVTQYALEGETRTIIGGQTFVFGEVAGFTSLPAVQPAAASPVIAPFDAYTLSYRSGHPTLAARIYCWSGARRVGTIDFQNEGAPLPANFYDGGNGGWGVYLFHPLSRFEDVLRILDSERPLHLYFTPDTLDAGIISSAAQAVGRSV